jgi:tripartite-type tricarboxylate transporter receptor subunit TctC
LIAISPDVSLNRRLLLSQIAAGCAAPALGAADDLTQVIVAYPPGGPVDVLARQLEPAFLAALGRPVVIENIPGAAGALGIGRLLRSAQTRPTMLVGTLSETILVPLLNRTLTYRPEQLRLVGPITYVPVALVGGTHLRATALQDLLNSKAAGSPPQTYGSYGMGSHAHLVGAEFSARSKLQLQHIPHGGVAALLREILGGRVDLAFLPLNQQLQDLIDKGMVRLYALASHRRPPRYQAAARIEEAPGFEGFQYDLWVGLFTARESVPARTGDARLALHHALADSALLAQKNAEGIVVAEPMSQTEADRWYSSEIDRYRALAERTASHLQF